MRTHRGFTLIELLVVVGILAILAGLAYPTFTRARAGAQRASCLANLHNIAQAALMYANDWDDTLPVCNSCGHASAHPLQPIADWTQWPTIADPYGSFPTAQSLGWSSRDFWQLADLLWPYVRNLQIFDCPRVSDPAIHIPYVTESGGVVMNIAQSEIGKITWSYLPDDYPVVAMRGMPKVGSPETPQEPYQWDWWDQCGSYCYGCCHFPYSVAGANPGVFHRPNGVLWAAACSLGYAVQTDDPSPYWVCGQRLDAFNFPSDKMMVYCAQPSAHDGYRWPYSWRYTFGGYGPRIPISICAAYVDGHARYYHPNYYQFLREIAAPVGGGLYE